MWIIPAVVVLAMLVLALFKGLSGGGGGGPENTTPSFDFKVTKALPILVTDQDSAQFAGRAQQTANAVRKTMTALYTEAFLDPDNWRRGSYDSVWPLFDDGSRTSAQQDGSTLTLGTNAGATFEEVTRPRGTVGVKVLLNKEDRPSTAVAIVRFSVLGTGTDGTYTRIVSRGQFFLRPGDGGGWAIYAFQVRRSDQKTVPQVGPSGSPSAVAT